MEKIAGIPTAIINGLHSVLDGILSAVKSIVSFLSGLLDSLSDLLRKMFVPADNYLDSQFQDTKQKLASRFDMDTYDELIKALKGYVANNLDFGGYIDISMWEKKLPTIKNFIRAFFYPLIILGDFNFLIWLFRGTSFGSDIAGKGGKDS